MKNTAKKSLAAQIILIAALVSVVLLVLSPLHFIYKPGTGLFAIWGWTGIFGGSLSVDLSGVTRYIECQFNWVLYVNVLLTLVFGVTTYLIGPKAKGYYIFAAIFFVVIAILNFTTAEVWVPSTTTKESLTGFVPYLGVGPWVGGIGAVVSAISCIVAHSFEK